MIDLGSYTGVPGSVAYGIGNSGDVVGQGQGTPGGVNHAILWDGGNAYDLNTLLDSSGAGWILEGAWDINDNGQIATYGRFQDGWMHALLLTPIPEPGSLALLAIGLVGVAYSRRGCRYKPDAGHPPYCGTDLSIPLQVRHSH